MLIQALQRKGNVLAMETSKTSGHRAKVESIPGKDIFLDSTILIRIEECIAVICANDHSRFCQRANVCHCLLCKNNTSLGNDIIITQKHMFLFGAETFIASVFPARTVEAFLGPF